MWVRENVHGMKKSRRRPLGASTRTLVLTALLGTVAHADLPERKPKTGAIARRCTVNVELQSVVVTATKVTAKVVMKNITSAPVSVSLDSYCGARFTLLGDTDNVCPPSPCKTSPPQTVKLGPKKSITLGSISVSGNGNTCRTPMPVGSTMFSANIVTDGDPTVCSPGSLHVIKDAKTGKLRKAKPGEPAPAPKPE